MSGAFFRALMLSPSNSLLCCVLPCPAIPPAASTHSYVHALLPTTAPAYLPAWMVTLAAILRPVGMSICKSDARSETRSSKQIVDTPYWNLCAGHSSRQSFHAGQRHREDLPPYSNTDGCCYVAVHSSWEAQMHCNRSDGVKKAVACDVQEAIGVCTCTWRAPVRAHPSTAGLHAA